MSLLSKPTTSSQAWVLRAWPCGETSAIASLLTREHGYVRVMAKGARGPRSLLRPLVEPGRLVQAEFSWDPQRELQYLRAGSVLLDCPSAAPSLEAVAYLLAALELADRCRPATDADSDRTAAEVFAVCEEFLRVLSSEASGDPARLFFAFEWQLLLRHGIAPEIEACAACGREHSPGEVAWFSPPDGGLVCSRCWSGGEAGSAKPLGADAHAALRDLAAHGLAAEGQSLARPLRRQVGAHLHRFLGYHMPGYRLPAALDLLRTGKDSTGSWNTSR